MTDTSAAVRRANERFAEEYSCVEAVWQALSADLPPEYQNFGNRLALGFAGGLGVGSVCGAISGAVLAIGCRYGRDQGMPRPEGMKPMIQELCRRVEERLGSLYCRDLKPAENHKEFCRGVVKAVTEIAAEMIAAGLPPVPPPTEGKQG